MSPTLAREIGKVRPFESVEEEAYLNLERTADALRAGVEALMREHGVTMAQYNALRILAGHASRDEDVQREGLPTSRIAEQMVTREPDMTRLIDRMERAGLVERRRSERDRRLVLVRPTDEGVRIATALREPLIELHRAQLGHLGAKRLASLNELIVAARRGVTSTDSN